MEPVELTIEQQFTLQSFCMQVDSMSPEQMRAMLKRLFEQMIVRDTIYKDMLKVKWGIDG